MGIKDISHEFRIKARAVGTLTQISLPYPLFIRAIVPVDPVFLTSQQNDLYWCKYILPTIISGGGKTKNIRIPTDTHTVTDID